jgi:NADH-quinone oxidoreductase subunit I
MLGLGIAKGMLTTLRHMLTVKPVTIQYPEHTMDMPAWTRGRPRLIYDIDSGDLRCTACGACAIACPVDVIQIHMRPGPERGKKIMDRFDLDMGGCIECALCVEACPFRAIVMAPDFEMATYDRSNSLVFNMHQLRIAGTPEVDAAMEYIQGVKRGLAGQAARGEAAARPAAAQAGAARPAPAAAARPSGSAAEVSARPAQAAPREPAAAGATRQTGEERAAAAPAAAEAGQPRRAPARPPPAADTAGMSPTRARLLAARAAQAGQAPPPQAAPPESAAAPATHEAAAPPSPPTETPEAGKAEPRRAPPPPPAEGSRPMSPTRARLLAARGQQAPSAADEEATIEATGAPPAPGEAARPLPSEPRSPEPGAQQAGQTPAATPAAHPRATPEAVDPSEAQEDKEPPSE